jgi:hypothetical protein
LTCLIESFKGTQKETVDVTTSGGTAESYYPFKKDKKYLVYAYWVSFSKKSLYHFNLKTEQKVRTGSGNGWVSI